MSTSANPHAHELLRSAWNRLITARRAHNFVHREQKLGLLGDAVSSAQSRREVEHKITSVSPPPTPTTSILASASLPARLGGFGRHWKRAGLIHAADKSGACGLRRRVFLCIQTHACTHACIDACIGGCVRLQTAPPLISSQPENDLDSAGCLDVFTYTEH